MGVVEKLMRQALLGLLHTYRYILSPWLGANCRYHPSCSQYASESIAKFGVIAGTYLAVKRLLRCHPWAAGGYDPVP
jgi:uncharacterized protein